MAELPPLSLSQDFIKWIFGVIRDESWDSWFSFLMIPNEIHEMPAGFNWQTKVAFRGVQFSLLMLHTGTCIIFFFSVFFWKAFDLALAPFQSSQSVPYSWSQRGVCWVSGVPSLTSDLVSIMVPLGHHPWFGTREGIVLSSNSPPPDLLRFSDLNPNFLLSYTKVNLVAQYLLRFSSFLTDSTSSVCSPCNFNYNLSTAFIVGQLK